MKVYHFIGPEIENLIRTEKDPTIILLARKLQLVIQRYAGFPFVTQKLTGIENKFTLFLLMFLSAFIIMKIVPVLIIRFVFKESLKTYVIGLRDHFNDWLTISIQWYPNVSGISGCPPGRSSPLFQPGSCLV